MTASCATCKFALAQEDATVCRRYPPTRVIFQRRMAQAPVSVGRPEVQPADWCGEFKAEGLL